MVDITEKEKKIMDDHGAYWRDLIQKEISIVFGPVADPKGAWGVAIFEAEDMVAAQALCGNDPAIKAEAGLTMEVLPMPQATIRKANS